MKIYRRVLTVSKPVYKEVTRQSEKTQDSFVYWTYVFPSAARNVVRYAV